MQNRKSRIENPRHTRWLLLVAAVVTFSPAPLHAEERAAWQSDYSAAKALAARRDCPLIVHFHASWCGPCRLMERNVLQSQRVLDVLADGRFVGVRVDSDRHPDLVKRFGVDALPSDLILAPGGRILARTEGAQDLASYLARLAHVSADFARSRKVQVTGEQGRQAPPRSGTPEAANPKHTAPNSKDQRPDSSIVGLDGYSPVSLWTSRSWQRGKKEFAAEFKDVTYWMTDAAELRAFRANPARYAPRLLGCDPVVLNEQDRALPGDTRYGAFFDGALYLFVDESHRKQFKQSPYRYTTTRHVLRADALRTTRKR